MTKRPAGGLRAVPHALREGLWADADPPPGRRRPHWVDWRPAILVPLTLVAVSLFIADANVLINGYALGPGLAVLFAGVQAVALLVALYRPVPAWWASTAAMVAAAWTGNTPLHGGQMFPWAGPGLALQAGTLFLLALRCRIRVTATALVFGSVLGLLRDLPPGRFSDTRVALAVLVVTAVFGAALRGLQRARTQLVAQEELTAEERARRTVLEERNRIARELHDVVAHHMSVISIQAQVAPHLVENPSDELKENLAGIRENAVEALTELRRVLGVLRSEDSLADGARHTPQPTLDRLDELVGNVRGAGLTVTTATTGAPRPLSPGVGLSAFRIVQEALSNAIRHAPGAEVRVAIAYHPESLTVRVVNSRPRRAAPPSPGVGHGLLGMGERTAMLGGELAAGATPDGGYEVTAVLPTKPVADPVEETL
ncbi:histidine kinase [Streptomyces sp. NPDC002537]